MVRDSAQISKILDNLAQFKDQSAHFGTIAFDNILDDDTDNKADSNKVFVLDSTKDLPSDLLNCRVHTIYPYTRSESFENKVELIDTKILDEHNNRLNDLNFASISLLAINDKDISHAGSFFKMSNALIRLCSNGQSSALNLSSHLAMTHRHSINLICTDIIASLCKTGCGVFASFAALDCCKDKFNTDNLLILKDIKELIEPCSVCDLYITYYVSDSLNPFILKYIGRKTLMRFSKYNLIIDFIQSDTYAGIDRVDVICSTDKL